MLIVDDIKQIAVGKRLRFSIIPEREHPDLPIEDECIDVSVVLQSKYGPYIRYKLKSGMDVDAYLDSDLKIEILSEEKQTEDKQPATATEAEAAAKPRTLGETDPAIASEFYRDVYSTSWYRDIKSQIRNGNC